MKRVMIFAMTVALLSTANLHARRRGPDEVASVSKDGIEYRVPHFPHKGYVEAWKGERCIWGRQIYVVKYSNLEGDVQDVFITKMNVKGNFLIITNERGSEYQLDLKSLEVTVLKGKFMEFLDDEEEEKKVNKKAEANVEIRSQNRTVARFDGQEYRVCIKDAGRCPDRCGSSGDYALFSILGYTGKVDPKGGEWKHFKFQVNTFYRQKEWSNDKVAEERKNNPDRGDLAGRSLPDLKPGDLVLLDWDQVYVREKTTNYYENRIIKLEKVDRQMAEKLIGSPLPNPPKDPYSMTNLTLPKILEKESNE